MLVFVTLPVDFVSTGGQVRRRKVMAQSFKALSAAGVEGVVVEVWWGLVERDEPGVYNWQGYLDLVALLPPCLMGEKQGVGAGDTEWE